MRVCRLSRLLVLEGKCCKKYLCCMFFIIASVSAIILYMQFMLDGYETEYYKPLCSQYPNGANISLNNIKYSKVEEVQKFDVEIQMLSFAAEGDLLRGFTINHWKEDWKGRILIQGMNFLNIDTYITEGDLPFSDDLPDDYSENRLWIKENICKELKITTGEQVTISTNVLHEEPFVVCGILKDDFPDYDFLVEEDTGNRLILQNGFHNRCNLQLRVPDVSEYLSVYEAMEGKSLRPSGNELLLEQMKTFRLIKRIIYFMTLVMVFAVAFIISYCVSVLLLLRNKNIMILKAFGLSNAKVMLLYLLLCEGVTIISNLVAYGISVVMALYNDGMGSGRHSGRLRAEVLSHISSNLLAVIILLQIFLGLIMIFRWKKLNDRIMKAGIRQSM